MIVKTGPDWIAFYGGAPVIACAACGAEADESGCVNIDCLNVAEAEPQTSRACLDCGATVTGGPTRCLGCAHE